MYKTKHNRYGSSVDLSVHQYVAIIASLLDKWKNTSDRELLSQAKKMTQELALMLIVKEQENKK